MIAASPHEVHGDRRARADGLSARGGESARCGCVRPNEGVRVRHRGALCAGGLRGATARAAATLVRERLGVVRGLPASGRVASPIGAQARCEPSTDRGEAGALRDGWGQHLF
jgi:hypothetical protein